MEIAKVIVDVPTMQTDQPYDYGIPESLQAQITAGMRVIVPFGKGGRKVQGFVVGIQQEADYTGTLKNIEAVMDLAPVLNQELLQLVDKMKAHAFAFKITCLQTMLPSVMRAKYEKRIVLIDEVPEKIQFDIFAGKDSIDFQEASDKGYLPTLMKLKQQDAVEVVYQVNNKAKVKTIRGVKTALTFEQLEEERAGLRKGSEKQQKLLSFLQSQQENITPVKDIKEQFDISEATLKTGEKKGWLQFTALETYRDPYHSTGERTTALSLTSQQQQVVNTIEKSMDQEVAQTFLLEGVTGSGKTEVYLQTIAHALENNKTAMMLVPEIALTPQMVKRFKERFGDDVAVMHSGLSDGEKYDEWRRVERKEAQVVVGARSAVFAPLENIGLIVIDEEHEASYKQEENPRYHARDIAIWRSEYHHCPVVLGSATPSLESRARAQKKVYQLLNLPDRINQQAMPEVEIVDLREEFQAKNFSSFSRSLQEKITERLAKKEQIVLLLNRRGYSSFVMCRECGFVLPCPNCDLSLTLHMDTHTMKCHYCGHEEAIPNRCPNCNSKKIRYYGTGTQKIQEELEKMYPEARILRMDVDTTRKKGAHEKILRTFGNHEADILLGTQMIAKGLDFPLVTLVGVLNADTALNLPDFRASERTFQLLTQVSGRAGRADLPGEVVVQSFNPDHYAIQFAKNHDYEGFYKREMYMRHQGDYPPYYYTILLVVSHPEEIVAAKKMYQIVKEISPSFSKDTVLLGPTPKAVFRVNNRYYYQTLIKYKTAGDLFSALEEVLITSQKEVKDLQIQIDTEPMHFM